MPGKKKENIWELLKRLDEEAGQFNSHLSQANRYFDSAAGHTKNLLDKHERDLQKAIGNFRRAVKAAIRKNKEGQKGKDKTDAKDKKS